MNTNNPKVVSDSHYREALTAIANALGWSVSSDGDHAEFRQGVSVREGCEI